MVAAQAGDAATYEKLLLEFLPFVRREVARRVREPSDRDDIVQNVLISLHRARHTYRSEHPFVPWLRAVVRNASIDWLRGRRRRSRFEWDGDVEDLAEPSYGAPRPDADELLMRADVRAHVRRGIDRLQESYRTVLILRDIEELDTAETAGMLGLAPGTVRVRLHRARLALRDQIERGTTPRPSSPSRQEQRWASGMS